MFRLQGLRLRRVRTHPPVGDLPALPTHRTQLHLPPHVTEETTMTTHPLTPALDKLTEALALCGIPAAQTADPATLIRDLNHARAALTVPLALLAPRLPDDIQAALLDWRIEAGRLSEALDAIAARVEAHRG